MTSSQDALGDGHAGLAADGLGHRAGGVEDELDVDLPGVPLGGRGQAREGQRQQERREREGGERAAGGAGAATGTIVGASVGLACLRWVPVPPQPTHGDGPSETGRA